MWGSVRELIESKDILSELVTVDQLRNGFAELPKLQPRFSCPVRRQFIYRAFGIYCPIRVDDLDIPRRRHPIKHIFILPIYGAGLRP